MPLSHKNLIEGVGLTDEEAVRLTCHNPRAALAGAGKQSARS
jgi:hypothetical protein